MPSVDSPIPFIDFSDFGDGNGPDAERIGKQFYAACRDVGFAYLINTGFPQEMVDRMFAMSKAFFELPQEIKMTAPHPPRGDQHRGYSGIGVEQVSQMVFDPEELAKLRKNAPDFKESYDMGSDESHRCKNIWLEDKYLPGLKSTAQEFMAEGRKLQMQTLRALAVGMPGVPAGFFEEYHTDGDNQLRLLHYPSAPAKAFESGEKGRIRAHTDFSTCTFLFQDDVGGLEVEDPHNKDVFLPAPPVPGAIVFNIGDFMMRWSNDELKSTLHRVRAPPRKEGDDSEFTKERYSIPYFCGANVNLLIDALPGTFSETRPKKYPPITAGEYVDMRLNATY